MEKRVEATESYSAGAPLQVRMFGGLTISRGGVATALPASRKVRALLAYLALAPRPVTRAHLCELLWDVPNDPRNELRWCLSKIRRLIDAPGRPRVSTSGDTVTLDLADCAVDALEVARAARDGIETLSSPRLRVLSEFFTGDFLEGLEIDRAPAFNGWLTNWRRRFRACHVAVLEHLVGGTEDEEAIGHLEHWQELAPFDRRAHEMLLRTLARRGRVRDGEQHLAAAVRLFESEGLDPSPIREAWRTARKQLDPAPRVEAAASDDDRVDAAMVASRRASIAVMPFADRDETGGGHGGSADGLAHDVITRLAKLRALFVIAQGTVFALHERRIGPEEAGRILNVDYIVGGSLRRKDGRLLVSVELTETRTARIVWAEVFNQRLDDAFLVLDEIGNRIVASIASEIETIERNRAILRPPNSLDAWEAYHRGLWHMYRFNRTDNERARHFFDAAIRLDPTFARAYSGLSFTHWQNAFQGWAVREREVEQAYAAAGQSLMVDDRDPAAHWAMGRALWLRGRLDQSVTELEQVIDLSPNFALGHYTLAFVHSQGGDPLAAIGFSEHSCRLSPFDPMLFGMFGARAMALVRLERFAEAAEWGVKAAARPNAHAHIQAIAVFSLALAGRLDEAGPHMVALRRTAPGYEVEDLLTAMQFDGHGAALFRQGAKRLGGA